MNRVQHIEVLPKTTSQERIIRGMSETASTSGLHEQNHLATVSNDSVTESTIKKKVRRKPRWRIMKKLNQSIETQDSNNTEENALLKLLGDFKITAIKAQTNGKFVRIKTTCSCKPIFVKSGNSCKITVATTKDWIIKKGSKSINNTESGTSKQSMVAECNVNFQLNNDAQTANTSNSSKRHQQKSKVFPSYWSEFEVQKGIEEGTLFKGTIRINSKNYREAYVSQENRSLQDFFIQDMLDRNRALEGDVVAIKLKPKDEWTEKQQTASVVFILEKVHSRTGVGFLQPMLNQSKQYVAFIPRDSRIPRIKIEAKGCPPNFYKHPNRFESMLFKVKIDYWKEIKYAIGTIMDQVGITGDLESETQALLTEYNLDTTPFPHDYLQFIPFSDGERQDQEEMQHREDLRKECVFTIDPLTARDLDDAVSCKELPNGNLLIGVHISDVSFFLLEGTPLDHMVCKKATTIYLVNNVYHMLPQELCMRCSLLPGVDKRAFSVFWEITKTGQILCYRFSRSVINSCSQLAYEHAQSMIENPEHKFKDDELPMIHGGFTYTDLSKTVNALQSIALILREKRFSDGALRIDQTKLLFRLDQDSGEPTEYFVYENKDAHRLIEEFMLLANITVARQIVKDFPKLAFLRCHDSPNQRLLEDVKRQLESFKLDLDISTSKSIQQSVFNIQMQGRLGEDALAVINQMLAKPMTRARYFCTGKVPNESAYQHYALHVPIYTHFTSPIRRYADIMVHRLLAASLRYSMKPHWDPVFVHGIAENCNKQKYNAKCAGDASSDLYFAHYVAQHQPFITSGVVIDVKNKSFDVLIKNTSYNVRIFNHGFDNYKWIPEEDNSKRKVTVVFPETSSLPEECYIIQLFVIVKVSLHRKLKSNKLEAKLLRPLNTEIESNEACASDL